MFRFFSQDRRKSVASITDALLSIAAPVVQASRCADRYAFSLELADSLLPGVHSNPSAQQGQVLHRGEPNQCTRHVKREGKHVSHTPDAKSLQLGTVAVSEGEFYTTQETCGGVEYLVMAA